MQSRSVDTQVKQSKGRPLPWKGKAEPSTARSKLLYLRPRPDTELGRSMSPRGQNGLLYALVGTSLGLGFGYLQYRYQLWGGGASLWNRYALELALPALLGGGLGALIAWLRAQRRLTQALITTEGFRRRLMSVERNQALWISLSAVLHDVRNPLHNVTLLVETLGMPGSDATVVREKVLLELERINTRIRRVVQQVSEFSGEIARRPVSLADVLEEVAQMITPLAKQSGVVFSINSPNVKVVTDPKFLVQAVDHLLLNSLQILSEQPSGKRRELSVTVSIEESSVSLLVDDTGPGLPEVVQDRLFEPLTASQPSGGMGLGLAIAHALATAAAGELMLVRTGANGTQFRLRLEKA